MHQSLGYTTPDVVYQTGTGGGVMIVDKFNELTETGVIDLSSASECLG
jgi:putative transposase